MTPGRTGAEDLFVQALDLAPAERLEFLDQNCGTDPQLRAEIESLLRWHELADAEGWDIPAGPDSQAVAHIRARTIRRAGPFDLQEFLGEGATGIVFRAIDTRDGKAVALKIASPQTMLNPANRQRFERAAGAAMRVEHPRIARVLETGLVENLVYVVTEYVDGRTLAAELKARRFDDSAVLRLSRQMAEALDSAHRHGIIHRDLKPANIMIDRDGGIRILDFGLCHAFAGAESIARTETGVALGTLGYMAPEQARGETPVPQSDLFSLGSVMYEMLTGRRAFRGDTPVAILASILHDRPEPSARRSRPMDLALWCLEKDPARRPPSAARVLAEIDRLERGGASLALRARRIPLGPRKALAIGALAAMLAIGLRFVLQPASVRPGRGDWVQLTRFSDSVSQPALSADGRSVAFIRGPNTFAGSGQIYVKALPDGEARQLTNDSQLKMSPVFSPDGSNIAYSTTNRQNQWDTWLVPAAGGEPRRWLVNASGLTWFGNRSLLFSEIKDRNVHMAIVTSDQDRMRARDIYVPANTGSMAHRSYASPDGRWVLLVEMDPTGVFQPCRLVPVSGGSPARAVGPAGSPCTSAAWSPDGKWMYLSSSFRGAFHVWRQSFPDGHPEQITSGPTEEEGIAIDPDGRSFISAVGLKQSAVWLHEASGERQLSMEGSSYDPKFTRDGSKICYRILKGTNSWADPSELQVLDLNSGVSKALLPGFSVVGGQGLVYDISPDGRTVVAAVVDGRGKSRLVLSPIDRSSPPRQIPNVEGDQPLFESSGDILLHCGGPPAVLCSVRPDGIGLRKLNQEPSLPRGGLSPDGKWLPVRVIRPAGYTTLLYSLQGRAPVEIAPAGALDYYLNWPPAGDCVFLSIPTSSSSDRGRTYALPLSRGEILPEIPPGGFRSEAQISTRPGAQRIDSLDVAPGPTSQVYAFARETLLRNLFRVRIP